jgi:hypothetical protein
MLFSLSLLLIAFWVVLNATAQAKAESTHQWTEIHRGFWLGEFHSPQKSPIGDSKITVLRIDPKYYTFKLMCASEHGNKAMTVKEWSWKYRLAAAINAGMYQKDELTSVAYMKNFKHINNPRLNKDNAILAFNPVDSTVPQIQIIDRKCQDFTDLRLKYHTFIQGIRMISCRQRNVWQQQPEQWSTAAIGMNKKGKVLFLFSQSPYSVHDFINILLSLPLSIFNAMYLEGGPHASLYVSLNGVRIEKHGMNESGFGKKEDFSSGLPIPNVIGVVKKLK